VKENQNEAGKKKTRAFGKQKGSWFAMNSTKGASAEDTKQGKKIKIPQKNQGGKRGRDEPDLCEGFFLEGEGKGEGSPG